MLAALRFSKADIAHRNFGMDLLRTVAILLVVVCHGFLLVPDFRGKYFFFLFTGYMGVEIFFVLSGFLIGGILLRDATQSSQMDWLVMRDFWIRRWFRTLPNYILFLSLNVVAYSMIVTTQFFPFSYYIFAQNLAWPCGALMPESWSLAVEEWFYLTMPLVLFLFVRLPMKRHVSIGAAIVAYIAVFSALRLVVFAKSGFDWDAGIRKVVVARLDAIGYGVLVAYLYHYYRDKVRRLAGPAFSLAAIAICILTVTFYYGIRSGFVHYLYRSVFFSFVSIAVALAIPFLHEINAPGRRMKYSIAHISIVSYSMYLLHFSFVIPFLEHVAILSALAWPFKYLTYLLLTAAASTVVYKYFEKPTTQLRERLTHATKNVA